MICLEMEFYVSGEFDRGRAAVWEGSGASAQLTLPQMVHMSIPLFIILIFHKAVWSLFVLDAVWMMNHGYVGSLDFLNKRARFWDLYKYSSGLRMLFLPYGSYAVINSLQKIKTSHCKVWVSVLLDVQLRLVRWDGANPFFWSWQQLH